MKQDIEIHTYNYQYRYLLGCLCVSMLILFSCYPHKAFSQENINTTSRAEFNNYKSTLIDTVSIKKEIDQALTLHNTMSDNDIMRDSAMFIFEKALKESELIQYDRGLGASVLYLGAIYAHTGRYNRGLNIFHEALNFCSSEKLRPSLSIVVNSIANMYQAQGAYEKAALYYYEALLMIEKYHLLTTGGVYINLGEMMLQLKQDKQALYFLNMAEKVCMNIIVSSQDRAGYEVLGYILINKSILYTNQSNWAKSEQYAKAAYYLGQKHNIAHLEYLSLVNLGNIYLLTNRLQQSINSIQAAQYFKTDIDLYYQNTAMRILGEAHYKLHNYTQSEYYLLKALEQAKKFHLVNSLAPTQELLTKLYIAKKQYQQALEHYQKYVQMKDSMSSVEMTKNIDQMEVKYRTAQKDKDIIKKQLQITQQQKWLAGVTISVLALIILLIIIYKNYQNRQKLQSKQILTLQQEQKIEQLKAVMEIEEKERARIARELHDGIGGMLAAMKMNLSEAKKKHPESQQLIELTAMLQDTASEVRKTAHNLMPDVLIRHNLEEALMLYCENINTSDQLRIDLQFYGALKQLNKTTELTLYRISQELIQNIIKHANASYAVIQIRQHEDKLHITVEDNGIGFDVNEKNGGFGLQNLRYRVQALLGNLSIMSAKGKSTTIYIEFDLQHLENTITS